jgi:hypothetical protein
MDRARISTPSPISSRGREKLHRRLRRSCLPETRGSRYGQNVQGNGTVQPDKSGRRTDDIWPEEALDASSVALEIARNGLSVREPKGSEEPCELSEIHQKCQLIGEIRWLSLKPNQTSLSQARLQVLETRSPGKNKNGPERRGPSQRGRCRLGGCSAVKDGTETSDCS